MQGGHVGPLDTVLSIHNIVYSSQLGCRAADQRKSPIASRASSRRAWSRRLMSEPHCVRARRRRAVGHAGARSWTTTSEDHRQSSSQKSQGTIAISCGAKSQVAKNSRLLTCSKPSSPCSTGGSTNAMSSLC